MRCLLCCLFALSACVSNPAVRPDIPDPPDDDDDDVPVAHRAAPPPSSCLPALPASPRAQRQVVEAIVRQGTTCADAYSWLGALQRRDGELDQAARNLRRALAIRADDADVLVELALVYYLRGENDLARLAAHHGTQLDNQHAPAHNLLGLLALRRGEVNDAIRLFERASELDLELVEAWMNLGQVSLSVRGYVAAARAFARVVEITPRSYDAHIGLGVAQRGLGQLDEAERSYRTAIELAADRPEAHFNLGVLYQDHREATIDSLQTARSHFQAFLQRAQEGEAQDNVLRRCNNRRCRPGRLQLLEQMETALTPP